MVECGSDVLTNAGTVQMGRCGVDREVDQFLGLVVEVVLLPRNLGEVGVGGEEGRPQVENRLPTVVPCPMNIPNALSQSILRCF